MLSTIFVSIILLILLIIFKSEFKKVRFYIKFYFYYVALSVVPLVILPFLLIRPRHHSNGVITSRYMRDFVNVIYGWEWNIRNKEILMEDRAAVIICNHQSVFDSTGINNLWVVAKKLIMIAKKEVLLYTEGTRNTKCDGKLLPFKKGAFNLAVSAQVPIIPVVFSPYYFFDKDKYIFDKGHLILQCLEPVPTEGLTLDDVPALTERLHQIISRTYEQLSKEVLSGSRSEFGSQIVKHVTKVIEVKWLLRNGKVLAEDRGAVVVSNHQSSIDILGMFNIWHVADKVAAIARKEIFYVWPFGLAAYLAGVVFIDRNNSKDAYKQLKITSEVMIKNKTKIWLFPEGTRNKDFTKLLPFKKGAFNIAVAAQCLDPVPTEGLTMEDVPALINKVRNTMDAAYKELSKEVLSALPPNYPLATD
ncbi:hypothetical protein HW555_006968 [Spodoptera exigua]|uniref:1-acylglycerol-3-phosphate O-acyltransferase n=1 Tax=Spodoptera exigua TaxID=7107 RepID=A0A835GDN5_SPOEX|nr:hypothetical protein HW555_006968 [Spodoptera exigua]